MTAVVIASIDLAKPQAVDMSYSFSVSLNTLMLRCRPAFPSPESGEVQNSTKHLVAREMQMNVLSTAIVALPLLLLAFAAFASSFFLLKNS